MYRAFAVTCADHIFNRLMCRIHGSRHEVRTSQGSMSGLSSLTVVLALASVGTWSSLSNIARLVAPVAWEAQPLAAAVAPRPDCGAPCYCHCDVNVTRCPASAPERWQPPGGALVWAVVAAFVLVAPGFGWLCSGCVTPPREAPRPSKRRLLTKTSLSNLAVDGSTL